MANVRGCVLPDELYYHVESNVWARLEDDGSLTLGMTSYACALAGQLVAVTPKKAGRDIEQGKTVSTVESGKWVGPVKAPVGGELLAVNEAVSDTPRLVNEDPYGRGWMAKLKPKYWETEKDSLVTGIAVAQVFEAKMHADGFGGC